MAEQTTTRTPGASVWNAPTMLSTYPEHDSAAADAAASVAAAKTSLMPRWISTQSFVVRLMLLVAAHVVRLNVPPKTNGDPVLEVPPISVQAVVELV